MLFLFVYAVRDLIKIVNAGFMLKVYAMLMLYMEVLGRKT